MRGLGAAAVVLTLSLAAAPTDARGATLASLVAGGTLETNRLVFDSFSYTGFTGGPAATAINVTTQMQPDGSEGLRFDGLFRATTFAQAMINYRVSANTGASMLSASLAGNPAATGTGFAFVEESFSGGIMPLNIWAQGGSSMVTDQRVFGAPRSVFTVTTQVRLNGTILAPSTVSLFEQTFGLPAGADFDSNGVVNGADFLIWQRNLGLGGAGPSQGDANGDLVVNAADLAIWRTQFGQAGSLTAIPEPTALTLAGATAMSLPFVRRRRSFPRLAA